MKRSFPVAAAAGLIACGTTFAQAPTTRSAVPMALTVPMPSVGAVGSGLGVIQPNLGSMIPAAGGALGSITTCPVTGIAANSTTDSSVGGLPGSMNATSALAPFGTSALAGTCSPSTPAIAPGFSNAAPLSSPGTITASAFGDGALPLDVTEAGGPGMSPMIDVPDPATSAMSCNGGSTMIQTPSLPSLFDNAGAIGISSPYGC